jgi:MFS family permease
MSETSKDPAPIPPVSPPPSTSVPPAVSPSPPAADAPVEPYSWYALVILILCYVFNYADRNILSILAQDVKADLGLSDASFGFLYGTAFAVFYAVFGIPFGRLADSYVRKNLVAMGLFFWSLMTALTGTARSLGTLAIYRVGVGVGEASLAPSAYSMLSDLFPKRLRATALALYSSGITLGAGLGFLLGGYIIDAWRAAFPDRASAPFGLAAWQAGFLAVGLPGLVLTLLVLTLREPERGRQDGIVVAPTRKASPLVEFGAVVPPFTLLALWHTGAASSALVLNLAAGVLCGLSAWCLSITLGNAPQWIALAAGIYAAFSWAQRLRVTDHPAFAEIFHNRAFLSSTLGFATQSFVTNGFAFWTPSYLLRAHDVSPSQVGLMMFLGTAIGGWIGTATGGVFSDRLKAKSPNGRLTIGFITITLGVPTYFLMVTASTLPWAAVWFFTMILVASMWLGPGAAAATELVPPHIRSTATAVYLLIHVLIGFAMGPFVVGRISDTLARAGQSGAEALGNAMLLSMLFWVTSVGFLLAARRYVAAKEAALAVH